MVLITECNAWYYLLFASFIKKKELKLIHKDEAQQYKVHMRTLHRLTAVNVKTDKCTATSTNSRKQRNCIFLSTSLQPQARPINGFTHCQTLKSSQPRRARAESKQCLGAVEGTDPCTQSWAHIDAFNIACPCSEGAVNASERTISWWHSSLTP